MKKITFTIFLAICCLGLTTAQAADKLVHLSIADTLNIEKIKQELDPRISLYWGDQPTPPIIKTMDEFKTSKRTNKWGKTESEACGWAMASVVKTLQDRAIREGGNAVINIRSNIKNQTESSTTEFKCLVGGMMVNVALKGTVVKLDK